MSELTSIGFGRGEVVITNVPLLEITKVIGKALHRRQLVEIRRPSGEVIIVNPLQIKVLQKANES